jgi:hypothetical protein
MNAEKIIEVMKYGCGDCRRNCEEPCWKMEHFGRDTADLIESLQAQLAEKETTLNGTYISMEAHEREVKKLKAEIGYEQDRIDCRNPICNSNREGMYRRCAELEELLDESQRRERAAVEDLSTYKDCGFCVHVQDQQYCYKNCQRHVDVDNFRTHPCWQWRGPQEGEGNAETDNPD